MNVDHPDLAPATTPRSAKRHLTRVTSVVVAGLLSVAVLSGCISTDQATAQNEINHDRSAHGVATLADYSPADSKAQAWADHLAQMGSLAHSNLATGYQSGTWCHLGENVGMAHQSGASTSKLIADIENGFMGSPAHRSNILNSVFDHVGTGVAVADNGYVFVVQEFVDRC